MQRRPAQDPTPPRLAAYLALTIFPALSSTISSNPTANMSAGLLSSAEQAEDEGSQTHGGLCWPTAWVTPPDHVVSSTRQPPSSSHWAHGSSLATSWACH